MMIITQKEVFVRKEISTAEEQAEHKLRMDGRAFFGFFVAVFGVMLIIAWCDGLWQLVLYVGVLAVVAGAIAFGTGFIGVRRVQNIVFARNTRTP